MLLFKVYFIAAAAPTIFSAFLLGFDDPIKLLWLIPIYFGSFFGFLLLHFIFGFGWSVVIKNSPMPKKPSRFYVYYTVSSIDIIDRFAGAKVVGFDKKALPDAPFLLVSNHISKFDPMVTAVHLWNRPSIFISKKSNFKLPNGPFINKAGYLPIDREDPRKALDTVTQAVTRAKQGYVVGVYPEGTRSKDGALGPFSDGVFMIAKKAEMPVVVVCVRGTKGISRNFFRRRTKVTLTLAGIIDAETVASLRSGAISSLAREMMEKTL